MTIADLLTALQAAHETARIYSGDHPAVARRVEHLHTVLTELLSAHPKIVIAVFDDRAVVHDRTVPIPKRGDGSIYSAIRASGAAGVRLTAGLTRDELGSFLAGLTAAPPRISPAGPHVSVLSSATHQDSSAVSTTVPTDALDRCVQDLSAVLPSAAGGGSLNLIAVLRNAQGLITTMHTARSTILPLMGLRSHDQYTFVHTTNVALLSAGLAEACGLSGEHVHSITLAALLHDVGKSKINPEILNKAGKLAPEELAEIQMHPTYGARLLLGRTDVPDLAVIVAYEHHMHRGGGGYPTRHADWTMHLATQIVQVADVYDALRTNRPYRKAMSHAHAAQIMTDGVPNIFEPGLLDVFFRNVAERSSYAQPQNPAEDPAPAPHQSQAA